MSTRLSVVIPHYNDLRGLDACLSAIGRQTLRPDEVIVADNASPQGERAVADVIAGRARLVVVPERGAGPARNGGVAVAAGEILAFTDSDCVPEPAWLEQGLAALATADFVGGAMRVLVDDEASLTPSEAFERVFAFDNETYVLRRGFTVTANLIAPRKVFDATGGFRVGVSEDVDWCHRAGKLGYRIGYAPAAAVGHPARRTWSELRRKWERLNAEGFALSGEARNARLKWFVKALAMPLSAVAHTPKVLGSGALSSLGDRFKALGVLYRLRLWRAVDCMRLLGDAR